MVLIQAENAFEAIQEFKKHKSDDWVTYDIMFIETREIEIE